MAFPHEVDHGHMLHQNYKLVTDVQFSKWNGRHPVDENSQKGVWPAGTKVRVVMVSRFGDCGITDNLQAERGYHARVLPEQLEGI